MKRSQLDKAIEALEAKKATLDLAIAELRAQQNQPKRVRKVKAPTLPIAREA